MSQLTKEDMDLKELARKRKLKALHIILSSFLAELAELGLLNQGSSNIIGTRVGRRVGKYFKDLNLQFNASDKINLLKEVIRAVDLTEDFISEEYSPNKISVKLRTSMCKYCPKGVGGAEISGTVCPIPYFLSSILDVISEEKYKVIPWQYKEHGILIRKPMKKEEGFCKFLLQYQK